MYSVACDGTYIIELRALALVPSRGYTHEQISRAIGKTTETNLSDAPIFRGSDVGCRLKTNNSFSKLGDVVASIRVSEEGVDTSTRFEKFSMNIT